MNSQSVSNNSPHYCAKYNKPQLKSQFLKGNPTIIFMFYVRNANVVRALLEILP